MKKLSLFSLLALTLSFFAVNGVLAKKSKAEKFSVQDTAFTIKPAAKTLTTSFDDEVIVQIKGNNKFESAAIVIDILVENSLLDIKKDDEFVMEVADAEIEDFTNKALMTLLYVTSEEDGTTFQYLSDENTTVSGSIKILSINSKNGKVEALFYGTFNNVLKSEIDSEGETISESRADSINIAGKFSTVIELD